MDIFGWKCLKIGGFGLRCWGCRNLYVGVGVGGSSNGVEINGVFRGVFMWRVVVCAGVDKFWVFMGELFHSFLRYGKIEE